MELNELKARWNALDKRLADNEIVNIRIVKGMIAQKTKSAYDRIYGLNIYNFVVYVLIMAVLFPIIYSSTPISTTSFVIVELAMVIGIIPLIRKITMLSNFDLEGKKCNELSSLVLRYKKVCSNENLWTITSVCIAMVSFYISELGFNQNAGYVLGTTRILLVLGLTLLTLAIGYLLGLWQRKRHAQQMQEIEQGLEELKEFEN